MEFLVTGTASKKYLKNHFTKNTEKLKRLTSIPFVQGFSESISRILALVVIEVVKNSTHAIFFVFQTKTALSILK